MKSEKYTPKPKYWLDSIVGNCEFYFNASLLRIFVRSATCVVPNLHPMAY